MEQLETDVVIAGAGPGGSTCSIFLAQAGIRSIIIEKEQFPRFHVGESMTGEVGKFVRKLGLEEEMGRLDFPVKHGVKVFGPKGKNSFWVPVMSRVNGGELVAIPTWQVNRSDFDGMLLEAARKRGAQVVKGEARDVVKEDGKIAGVTVQTPDGDTVRVRAKFVVDATGAAGFLCRSGVTGKRDSGHYAKQIALFAQFRGLERDPGPDQGNTLIFYKARDHWAWFIPVSSDRTSIGVVVPAEHFKAKGESKRDFILREMGDLNSELSRRVEKAELAEEVRACSNYSYRIHDYAGDGFLCIGDAHQFIDPIFSLGVFFSMKEAELSVKPIQSYLAGDPTTSDLFAAHTKRCDMAMEAVQLMIDAFWEQPLAFSVFAHQRYREDFIDMFAGRVFDDTPLAGLEALRKLLTKNPVAFAS